MGADLDELLDIAHDWGCPSVTWGKTTLETCGKLIPWHWAELETPDKKVKHSAPSLDGAAYLVTHEVCVDPDDQPEAA